MRIPLLYESNNIYVNTPVVNIKIDDKEHIYHIEEYDADREIIVKTSREEAEPVDNFFILHSKGDIPYNDIAYFSMRKNEDLYYLDIDNIYIEFNSPDIILDHNLLHNVASCSRILRKNLKFKGKPIFRIMHVKHGFYSVYLLLHDHIIGPVLFEDITCGYIFYLIDTVVLNKKTTTYLPYERTIEFKRVFYGGKDDNKNYYIKINGTKYIIDVGNNITKDLIEKESIITFAYAKISNNKVNYLKGRNQINNIDFKKMYFYDINLDLMFTICGNTIKNHLDKINLVSYFFPYFINLKEYDEEDFICNLTYHYSVDKIKMSLMR